MPATSNPVRACWCIHAATAGGARKVMPSRATGPGRPGPCTSVRLTGMPQPTRSPADTNSRGLAVTSRCGHDDVIVEVAGSDDPSGPDANDLRVRHDERPAGLDRPSLVVVLGDDHLGI